MAAIPANGGRPDGADRLPLGVKSGKVQTEQMFSGLHLKADARRLRVHALIDRERAAALPLVALPHLAAHRPRWNVSRQSEVDEIGLRFPNARKPPFLLTGLAHSYFENKNAFRE